jgi:hypothetical protein
MEDQSSRLRLDFKRGVGAHLSFLFVDAVYLGPARAVVQPPGKFGQLFFRPHGVHLHPAVIEVSHISAEAEFGRDTLRKISEPYALHAPAHPPAAGDLRDSRFRAHAKAVFRISWIRVS